MGLDLVATHREHKPSGDSPGCPPAPARLTSPYVSLFPVPPVPWLFTPCVCSVSPQFVCLPHTFHLPSLLAPFEGQVTLVLAAAALEAQSLGRLHGDRVTGRCSRVEPAGGVTGSQGSPCLSQRSEVTGCSLAGCVAVMASWLGWAEHGWRSWGCAGFWEGLPLG